MQTVAGDLLAKGEAVEWEGWHFEVLDLDGRRIDRVLIVRRVPLQVPDVQTATV